VIEPAKTFCDVRTGGVAGQEALLYLRECCRSLAETTNSPCAGCRATFEAVENGVILHLEIESANEASHQFAETTADDAMLAIRSAFAQLYRRNAMRGSIPPPAMDWTRAH